MIEKSFSVSGITTYNQQKVRNDEFITQNANEKILKKKKDYLKNTTKIHSTIYNLVACILFLEQVYTMII